MEANVQHEHRLATLEEGARLHEATHGRMWDKINQHGTEIAVERQKNDDNYVTLSTQMRGVETKLTSNSKLLISALITGLFVFAGLVANLIVMLASHSPG